MNCGKARKWISLELDGELSPRRRVALERHLRSCALCWELKEDWASLGERLRARPVSGVPAPEAAWADVRRAIRTGASEPVAAAAPAFVLRWAAVAATVLALAVSLAVLLRGRPGAGPARLARSASAEVEWVETGLPDATTMVYEDAESGAVVIWVVEAGRKEDGRAGS